jgi:hypothetical protein
MQKGGPIHYPRLDTILMVEDALRSGKEFQSKRQLWLSLNKAMMYQTFDIIIKYLEESKKLVITNGKVVWTGGASAGKEHKGGLGNGRKQ